MAEEIKKGYVYTCIESAVKKNAELAQSNKVVLELLEAHPELDKHLGVVFNLTPPPNWK